MTRSTFKLVVTLAVFALMLTGAWAQDSSGNSGPVSVGQGVGRISLIHGSVSTQRGDSGDVSAAALNAPLVTGDRITTGDDSRAEVQLDYANILRLGSRSQANIATLTDRQIQVQVSEGQASYTAMKTSEVRPEVDTPNLAVRPSEGDVSFRILVISPEETQVIVRKGKVEVSTPSGSTQVEKGQVITVRGSASDAQFKLASAGGRDEFDKWNDERDGLIRSVEKSRTGPYYTGAQDLDAYGHWTSVPDYGDVWVPSVDVGWAPYRLGHWVWEPYWGWTWVSYEPWGWAPYHYGRWFYYGSSWVWWPGYGYGYGYGRHYRPIWAPAYVSFFGFGGFGVGFGFGSFSWLPCGPGDYFYPWWGGYRNQINVVNVTNIYNNNYRGGDRNGHWGPVHPLYRGHGTGYSNLRLAETDERVREGISTVKGEHFGAGTVVRHPIEASTFRQAQVVTGTLPVVPTRDSLSASGKPAPSNTVRPTAPTRFFGSRPQAAPVESFDRQAAQVQQAIEHSGFPAHGTATGQVGRPAAPAAPAAPPQAVGGTHNSAPGAPSAPAHNGANLPAVITPTRPGTVEQEGWHRFGGNNPQTGTVPSNSGRTTPVPSPAREGSAGRTNERLPEVITPRTGNTSNSNNDGWQRFPAGGNNNSGTPAQGTWNRTPEAPSRGTSPNNETPGGTRNDGWDRGTRNEPRSEPSGGNRPPAPARTEPAPRPTLDMRQPVVTPRPAPAPAPAPAPHGGNSGGNSSPHGGSSGGSSAPHGGGGGSSSHSSGGGGSSHGGGNHR